jgi:hypothetical protein
MTNDMTNRQGTDLATPVRDPFAAYAAKMVVQQGNYLSFKAGEYLYGQNSEELKLGTRLAANMLGLRVGWRRWRSAKVEQDLTQPLVDGIPEPDDQHRHELGDTDSQLWDLGANGDPMDPWQWTSILELVDATGEKYIYSTGSKGGKGAIGALCDQYNKQRRAHPDQVPIIELGRDFYTHPSYGKTYFPVFTIVGWTDEDNLVIPEAQPGLPPMEAMTKGAPAAGPKKTRF